MFWSCRLLVSHSTFKVILGVLRTLRNIVERSDMQLDSTPLLALARTHLLAKCCPCSGMSIQGWILLQFSVIPIASYWSDVTMMNFWLKLGSTWQGLRSIVVKVAGKSMIHGSGFYGAKFTSVRLHFLPFTQVFAFPSFVSVHVI
jgi:hypothetical protein